MSTPFAGIAGMLLAAAGVPFAVYGVLMLDRGWNSDDAPFWIFAVYAGIALVITMALWAFAALQLRDTWGRKQDGHN